MTGQPIGPAASGCGISSPVGMVFWLEHPAVCAHVSASFAGRPVDAVSDGDQSEATANLCGADSWLACSTRVELGSADERRTPDRNAVWAPDGTLMYFLSERDGFRCFWAQRLEAKTKRPKGEPFVVQHFHQARLSYAPDDFCAHPIVSGPGQAGVSRARKRTGNIWLARLESR